MQHISFHSSTYELLEFDWQIVFALEEITGVHFVG